MERPRYQTPIKFLWLPSRIHNALIRWGIRYIEELMGSDPLYFVQTIGPDDHWVGPHTLSSGTMLEFYRHTLHADGSYHLRSAYDPWLEIPRIGPAAITVILAAIEQWREENRASWTIVRPGDQAWPY